jgi:hypothetical protein
MQKCRLKSENIKGDAGVDERTISRWIFKEQSVEYAHRTNMGQGRDQSF